MDCPVKCVTGGHKYNDAFMEYLSNYSNKELVCTPCCSTSYLGWRKIYAPFAELKWLRLIESDDLVFWNDTANKYHFILAFFVGLFKDVRSFLIVHHFPEYPNTIKWWFFKKIHYWYFSKCGKIIVPSPYTLDVAHKLYPNRTIYYIPLPFKKEYNASKDYKQGVFLYVGTIEKRKGLHLLIDALNIVHQVKPQLGFDLNIVGKTIDEEYKTQVKNKVLEYGLADRIHFLGRVTDEELVKLYNEAEIFTFPSLLEGYGIVIVEALNNGIPVIAFNNSAMPYSVLDGVNGFLAENENVKSFAGKILLLSGNRSLRLKLQDGIKKTVAQLKSQEDFEKGIRDLYELVY